MIEAGAKAEEAREVLGNAAATEIMMKANVREWRHILQLRAAPAAYPKMRHLMSIAKAMMQAEIPVVFDDI